MIQSNDLVMIALGIDRDAPALPEQPRLADGIHLRWAFRRERGFPWYGYQPSRRTSEKTAARCLASEWQAASTAPGATTFNTPDGTLSSDTTLALTDDFDPHGESEVDLRGRAWLRLDLPPGEAACQIALTIGFHQVTPVERCIEFLKQTPGALEIRLPWSVRVSTCIGRTAHRCLARGSSNCERSGSTCPPDALAGRLLTDNPTEEDAKRWLTSQLDGVFPKAEDLILHMKLEQSYKDVTFETLNKPEFLCISPVRTASGPSTVSTACSTAWSGCLAPCGA